MLLLQKSKNLKIYTKTSSYIFVLHHIQRAFFLEELEEVEGLYIHIRQGSQKYTLKEARIAVKTKLNFYLST